MNQAENLRVGVAAMPVSRRVIAAADADIESPVGRRRGPFLSKTGRFLCRTVFLSKALAIYFLDMALANAFVARWCLGYRVESIDGAYHVRDEEPRLPVSAPAHKTP